MYGLSGVAWRIREIFGLGGRACPRCVLTSLIRRAERFKTNVSFLPLLLFAETKRITIQFAFTSNSMRTTQRRTMKKQLRTLYDSITIHKRDTSRTQSQQRTNKDSQCFNSQTKQQTKSIATKKDHKEKSNNKLIEYTYEDTYSSR